MKTNAGEFAIPYYSGYQGTILNMQHIMCLKVCWVESRCMHLISPGTRDVNTCDSTLFVSSLECAPAYCMEHDIEQHLCVQVSRKLGLLLFTNSGKAHYVSNASLPSLSVLFCWLFTLISLIGEKEQRDSLFSQQNSNFKKIKLMIQSKSFVPLTK